MTRGRVNEVLIWIVVLCSAACFLGWTSVKGLHGDYRCTSGAEPLHKKEYTGQSAVSLMPFGIACPYIDPKDRSLTLVEYTDLGTPFLLVGAAAVIALAGVNTGPFIRASRGEPAR